MDSSRSRSRGRSRGRSRSRSRSRSISRSRSRDHDNDDDDFDGEAFYKLKQVVDDYYKNSGEFAETMITVPVNENMFNDSHGHEKLNIGDIVYHNDEFTIVVSAGKGRVKLGRISQHPQEFRQPYELNELLVTNQLGPDDMDDSFKVNFNTVEKTGGKSRKSKKSRKTIKARKSRKM